ncbi:MAG TPA: GGDEF domain-containing protein [Solirubrobacteraceae bacterium]|jgi:diguanylate cyclase (GGDEF)-like protein
MSAGQKAISRSPLTDAGEASEPARKLDPNDALPVRVLLGDLARTIGCEVALLCEPDLAGRPQIVCAFGTDGSSSIAQRRRNGALDQDKRGASRGFVGRALTHERATVELLDPELDAALVTACPHTLLTQALAAPVWGPGDIGGALVAGFAAAPADLGLTMWAAESYAAMAALVRWHPDALPCLLDVNRTDHLTGCITYDTILRELSREIERATRSDDCLSCCFIDLDGFKRVNDRQGHLYGNQVLAHAAQVLRAGVRSCDTIGRYGGDEFVAILPQTSAPEARGLSERLRSEIASARLSTRDERVTASIGVAEWIPCMSAEQLLARADHALLTAKTVGGDVVIDDRSEA